jgi:redox-sensitive bicupin YhaK (pirin superfamily)
MNAASGGDTGGENSGSNTLEAVFEPNIRNVDGMTVRRVLPLLKRRTLGPFVFFDHVGPFEFPAGKSFDVRPHPHIGLATVTYLFEGEMVHRDSLGRVETIRPGDINWMTAGRGIVHSERASVEARTKGGCLHAIQLWVGLPKEHEETEPAFHHHNSEELPEFERGNVRLKLLLGSAYGENSPVPVFSPLFYLIADLAAGAELALPEEHIERAAHVVSGKVSVAEVSAAEPALLIFKPGTHAVLRANEKSRVLLLGGAPLDGPRFLEWNFVSSDKARLEQAKRDWRERRFPLIPGDSEEFIPLPE